MKDLLNNWVIQAIIGNLVCYLLSKLVKSFHKWLNSPLSKVDNNKKCYPKYSKKALRKQFYISLAFAVTNIPIFFLTTNQYLKCISFFMMFFSVTLFHFAFECALDSFEDVAGNWSKNNTQ